ncbi:MULTISPECIES: GspH/FimT family protein [Nitrincola]|uniref:Type II secretion system protein H n=1 Tax=Nitrincola nitratireducens TaxID=1229521 RepID=W9UTK2_9GAMM|nr:MULTISPECIES: GspH/FimT family pseudopilin [Nitrincola]EXJ10404.1 hypothetical protein D791_02732 [Nitrincola nitratireducens]
MSAFRMRGYTLLELMVTLLLLAILLLQGVPAFSDMSEKMRQETRALDLVSLLSYARIQAVTHRQSVTLCRTLNGLECVGHEINGGSEWFGVLVFIDTHQSRQYDPLNDEVLRVHFFSGNGQVLWNRGDSLTYQADGTVTGYSNGTFRVRSVNQDKGYNLVISLAGRVRRESVGY